jgi:hypothetical protein
MATMKSDLGFPDASVMVFSANDIVVAVVDPEHPERVVLRPEPEGVGYVPEKWEPALELVRERPMAFQLAVLHYATWLEVGADEAMTGLSDWEQELDQVEEISSFLEWQEDAEDLEQALWCLQSNANANCRRLAAAILMNFADRDVAWWALMESVRDSNEMVSSTCSTALRGLAKHFSRRVDWRPVADTLQRYLNGTRISAFSGVVDTLLATEVDPALAPRLLAGGAPALLDFVAAEKPFFQQRASALLLHLGAPDGGRDRGAWADWVEAASAHVGG